MFFRIQFVNTIPYALCCHYISQFLKGVEHSRHSHKKKSRRTGKENYSSCKTVKKTAIKIVTLETLWGKKKCVSIRTTHQALKKWHKALNKKATSFTYGQKQMYAFLAFLRKKWSMGTSITKCKKHLQTEVCAPRPANVCLAVPSSNRENPMINTSLGIRKRAVQLLFLSYM